MDGDARVKDIIVGKIKDTDVGKDGTGWNLSDDNWG